MPRVAITFLIARGERKYLGSGCASKMSDNEYPFPVLRDTIILAVKHLPLEVIPQLIKRLDDGFERLPLLVTEKPFYVFKQEKLRPLSVKQSEDIKEDGATGIGKSLLFSSD